MRTTLTLDDDVYSAARALAEAESQSIGRVVSRLIRQGVNPRPRPGARSRGGFPVISLPVGAPPVTGALVARALDDEPTG